MFIFHLFKFENLSQEVNFKPVKRVNSDIDTFQCANSLILSSCNFNQSQSVQSVGSCENEQCQHILDTVNKMITRYESTHPILVLNDFLANTCKGGPFAVVDRLRCTSFVYLILAHLTTQSMRHHTYTNYSKKHSVIISTQKVCLFSPAI